MPIYFNSILSQFGFKPENVILLRHQDRRSTTKRTIYEMWRDDRSTFDFYQSTQAMENRSKFSRAGHWASFVATPHGSTMFVGLYSAQYKGPLPLDTLKPANFGFAINPETDAYELHSDERLADLIGRLFIEWGDGTRAWVQRADNQNKTIVELHREFTEPSFPGFLNFRKPLSEIQELPLSWIEALKNSQGVYLLTCPKTKEHYVGSACGADGFWQRWMNYVINGHGGNIALKSREASDYQVTILEVAGSAMTPPEILQLESKWKQKLQSREMGLNSN